MTALLHKKKFPLFTLVTITLNNYDGLIKTYGSIKNQNFDSFEWIVIDGGSTDETLEFLRKHRSETRTQQHPFQFLSEPDDGLYDAMNKGIEKARGHYILFLNAGDQLAQSDTLETISKHTQSKPEFIYGDALDPQYKTARRYKDIAWGMITHHQSMLYRRHTIRDFKMHYSLLYTIASDYDFTLRFLQKAKKIIYIPKPICIFEQGGLSQKNAALGRKEQFIIREKLELVPVHKNLYILCIQAISWNLRRFCPWGYRAIKSLYRLIARKTISQ